MERVATLQAQHARFGVRLESKRKVSLPAEAGLHTLLNVLSFFLGENNRWHVAVEHGYKARRGIFVPLVDAPAVPIVSPLAYVRNAVRQAPGFSISRSFTGVVGGPRETHAYNNKGEHAARRWRKVAENRRRRAAGILALERQRLPQDVVRKIMTTM